MSRLLLSLPFLLAGLCLPLRAAESPAVTRPATVTELAVLDEAVRKTMSELNRWAYTETRIMRDDNGKTKSHTIVRYDPSKPYAQQWTPLPVNGKSPTERELARARRRGEQARKRAENPAAAPTQRERITLGEVMEPGQAKVVSETPRHLVLEIPLRKRNNDRFPPDKFLVLARVDRERKTLENVAVRLREPFRMKIVAKVKAGEGSLDFTTVDPKFAPTLTAVQGDASVSILFVSVGGEFELKRTDFKRVKPYGEQFEVQIGELKALDF